MLHGHVIRLILFYIDFEMQKGIEESQAESGIFKMYLPRRPGGFFKSGFSISGRVRVQVMKLIIFVLKDIINPTKGYHGHFNCCHAWYNIYKFKW